MREKLFSCLLLISLQGGTEDRLKVGGGRGGSVGVSLGHHSCLRGREKGGGWEREHCGLAFHPDPDIWLTVTVVTRYSSLVTGHRSPLSQARSARHVYGLFRLASQSQSALDRHNPINRIILSWSRNSDYCPLIPSLQLPALTIVQL